MVRLINISNLMPSIWIAFKTPRAAAFLSYSNQQDFTFSNQIEFDLIIDIMRSVICLRRVNRVNCSNDTSQSTVTMATPGANLYS